MNMAKSQGYGEKSIDFWIGELYNKFIQNLRKSEEKRMKIENLCINCMREMQEPGGICEFCGFNVETFELPRHHMRPFTILAGKYLIGNVIGEGGFGITYIGMDLNLEVRVAIKEYYPQGFAVRDSRTNDSTVWSYSESTQTFFEEGREKFINEAKTIAKFRELPEIVGVTDFFRENQTAYIVMEYLDGQTLRQYLKINGEKIPAENVVQMMRPLIASLGKLHSQNLIHRDISPDNIMLMKDGNIKILDFGGAREFASQDGRSMSVLVKYGYAPKEQYWSRGDQGPWTDVYALCATMYRCITGEIPPNALDRLYQDELKPISSFGVNCPKYIEQAITKGMSVRKDGRYQSMEELYEALYSEQKKKNPKKASEKTLKSDKKKKIIIAATVAVVVGVTVAVATGIEIKQTDQRKVAEIEASDQEIIQTASGVNIIKKNATYYAKTAVNIRPDCNAWTELLAVADAGQKLTSTGISEDGDWIEIEINGKTGYVLADWVSMSEPTASASESASATEEKSEATTGLH